MRAGTRGLEQRVARIEDLLGLVDAGPRAPGRRVARAPGLRGRSHGVVRSGQGGRLQGVAGGDRTKASKVNAAPAQAACADEWSDKKKQACFYAAMATLRTSQAARDALMLGGAAAREAVKGVKDDPKNDALVRARASADAVFVACDDDGG